MVEILRFLLLPCLVAVGWMASRALGDRTRMVSRVLIGTLVLFVLGLAVSGGWHDREGVGQVHKWAGYAMIIVAYLAIPFVLGVVQQQGLSKRPIRTVIQSLMLITVLMLIILGSMTGYLGPSYDEPGDVVGEADQEALRETTQNRFEVLHLVKLPVLIGAMTVGLWVQLRPERPGS